MQVSDLINRFDDSNKADIWDKSNEYEPALGEHMQHVWCILTGSGL